jgi:hypothetical protein
VAVAVGFLVVELEELSDPDELEELEESLGPDAAAAGAVAADFELVRESVR